MQRRAAGACRLYCGGACAALCPPDPMALLRVPCVRPHLLGGHALAAHARGARGALRDVLRRLTAGELTEDEALAELRNLQLEELAGRARLDLGRFMRRGVPEVVLATGKAPHEAARLAGAPAPRPGPRRLTPLTAARRAPPAAPAAAAPTKNL